MPFANHGNRSFTMISVEKNGPAASGVYGLSNASQWIYVGETANIHAELCKHLQHPNTFLRGAQSIRLYIRAQLQRTPG